MFPLKFIGFYSIQGISNNSSSNPEEFTLNDNVNILMRSISLIIQMINEFEGLKPLQDTTKELIVIKVNCQSIKNQMEKNFKIELMTNMTLMQAKNMIANRLNPSERAEDFDFFTQVIFNFHFLS